MTYYKCGRIHPTQNSNVVVDTSDGAIANFNTPLCLPLLETKFGVKATQEAGTPTPQSPKAISGVSAVSVFHCHKNLYQYDASKATTGTTSVGATRSYLPLGLKGACTLTFSASLKEGQEPTVQFINIGKKVNGIITPLQALIQAGTIFTRTIPFNAGEEIVLVSASEQVFAITSSLPRYDIQIEVSSEVTSFEETQINTTVINLGGTYYGGYVTQDKNGKRELVVTHGVKLFSELSFGRSNNSGVWEGYRFYALVDKLRGKDVKCSHYEAFSVISASNIMENETLIAPLGNDYIYVKDDNYTTVEAFKTANANTQLWYELAEPYTIDLPDGEPIKSLPGVNNIFCDTGDTSVKFRKIG